MKLVISSDAYNEIVQRANEQGIQLNTGATALTLEKNVAITDGVNYRFVAIRQNCLMAASEVFKINEGDFIKIAQEIFNWCLNGETATENNSQS